MHMGTCQLCGQPRELQDSHVWPKFAYKKYTSDKSDGGSFLDLSRGGKSNHQYTNYWFCHDCEQILSADEDFAARFCSRVEKAPSFAQEYDERLLRFAVSISLRTLMSYLPRAAASDCEDARAARRQWSSFLRGKTQSLACYTQHVFLVRDEESKRHQVLGGQVFWDHRFVLSQIGPLHILGLLDRTQLDSAERRIWERSKLEADGGVMIPVSEWRVGHNITMKLIQLLWSHEKTIIKKVVAAGQIAYPKRIQREHSGRE